MLIIYVLQLEKGKYYIGKTNNINARLNAHFFNGGSEWTKLYKPTKLIEQIENCDDYDEDKYTIKYMAKYGVDNVRGGSFVKVCLNEHERIVLSQMINGNTNKCFKCGQSGHFVRDCLWDKNIDIDLEPANVNKQCNCFLSYIYSHYGENCLLNNLYCEYSPKTNADTIIDMNEDILNGFKKVGSDIADIKKSIKEVNEMMTALYEFEKQNDNCLVSI